MALHPISSVPLAPRRCTTHAALTSWPVTLTEPKRAQHLLHLLLEVWELDGELEHVLGILVVWTPHAERVQTLSTSSREASGSDKSVGPRECPAPGGHREISRPQRGSPFRSSAFLEKSPLFCGQETGLCHGHVPDPAFIGRRTGDCFALREALHA